jgi:hypothetical protein
VPIASWTSPVVLLAGLAGAAMGPEPPPAALYGGAHSLAGAPAGAAGTDTLRLHWVIVSDTQMTGRPVEAVRLLAPAGWTSAGEVHWDDRHACLANLVQMTASARSPDGLAGFEIFTPYSWQWADDSMTRMIQRHAAAAPGGSSAFCPLADIMTPAGYIRRVILPRFRPGAREIAAEAMPRLAATVQSQLDQAYAPLLATHRYTSVHGDAGRVKIAYDTGGHPVEEWIMATTEVVAYPQRTASARKPGDPTQAYSISAAHVFAYRAPAGTLGNQSALAATMVASIRANPEWVAARDRMVKQLIQRQIGIVDRRKMRVASSTDPGAPVAPGLDSAESHLFDEFASAPQGLAVYADPATHARIALDASRHAWTSSAGEYLLSGDPAVELNRVPGGPWMPLKPEDP